MLWRSAEGYIKHWFALFGAMLVVALRAPLASLFRDSWLYGRVEVFTYKLRLESALITTITILTAMYIFFKWIDHRGKMK